MKTENLQTTSLTYTANGRSGAVPIKPTGSVLLVGNFLSSHFGRGVCEDLALRLSGSGWSVLTTSDKLKRLPRLLNMMSFAWTKRNKYNVAQVDVYSGPAFSWAEAVCWILRRAGKPYVLALHGGNLPAFSFRWPRRVRSLLRSASAVTVPSNYLLDQMRIYRNDLRLLPNPLDATAYDYSLRQQPTAKLIWLRAFDSIYNPLMAPKVLALLQEDFPDVHLTMIGPDKEDGSLQNMQLLASELGVTERILLPGRVPKSEISSWMNRGDIFLNTTNIDNTPVSLLEAMACGLCIVSTNVGGIPYLLTSEEDALLVPPNDPEAMSNAVRRILTKPDLAEKLSCNARTKALSFDWSVILPQWESLLSDISPGKES